MHSDLEKLQSLGLQVGVIEEPKQEQPQEAEEQIQEPQLETNEESSLQTQETVAEADDLVEIVDLGGGEEKPVEVDLISAFNEKFGTAFKTEEEVLGVINKKNEEISEQALKIDKFLKETGRPFQDWWITQIDYTKIPDNEMVIQSLMNESKIDRETAVALFEDEYAKVEIDEDIMSDKEVASAKRKNAAIDARLKQRANAYRNEMEGLKEKYSAPLDGWKPQSETQGLKESQDAIKWQTEMQDTLKELETLQIDLGNGKAFKFSAKDYIGSNSTNLLNIEKAFAGFYKEDGSGFDTKRFAKADFLEKNFDKIVKSIYTHAYGQGAKATAEAGKNLKYDVQGAKGGTQTSQKSDWEKQAMETLSRVWNRNKLSVKI